MEANICDVSHLDADALLPPRKRLLAGLKKQNFDGNSNTPSPSSAANKIETSFDRGILRSHLNDHNHSSEEIIEFSRLAAEAAVKVAEAARASAEEKAAKAAKAVAAAKSALELVAIVSEEAAGREGDSLKKKTKNKMKRQVPVQMLYNKHEFVECGTDEELARKLHQAMNSSTRISKNSSSSGLKGNKHKKLKSLSSSCTKSRAENGGAVLDGRQPSMSNGNNIAGGLESEGSMPEELNVIVDENTSPLNKTDLLKTDKVEAKIIQAKEKIGESLDDASSIGRKGGRLKQKKLLSSICNYRDQANPKEEPKSRSTWMAEKNISKTPVGDKPVFSVGCSSSSIPVEKMSVWKCHEFKATPACAKQNKVMQS